MKKLIIGITVVVGVMMLHAPAAKADSRTLHGVADIIWATGTVLNGGYNTTVYYEPYPVRTHHYYYTPRPYYREYYRYDGYNRSSRHHRHHNCFGHGGCF